MHQLWHRTCIPWPVHSQRTIQPENPDGSQERRRRDEDGEGERGQVRRLPLHRHPRQGAARHRARVPFRRGQVQLGPCLRRLLGGRLEGHRGVRHAADAGPRNRQHRPLLRRDHADPLVRRARARRRQGLRPRPALDRQACRGLPQGQRPGRHGVLRSRARVLHLRRRPLERRPQRLLRRGRRIRSARGTPARRSRAATRATGRPPRAATSRCRRSTAPRTCAPRCR